MHNKLRSRKKKQDLSFMSSPVIAVRTAPRTISTKKLTSTKPPPSGVWGGRENAFCACVSSPLFLLTRRSVSTATITQCDATRKAEEAPLAKNKVPRPESDNEVGVVGSVVFPAKALEFVLAVGYHRTWASNPQEKLPIFRPGKQTLTPRAGRSMPPPSLAPMS